MVHHGVTKLLSHESRVGPFRVDRETGGQHMPVLLSHLAQAVDCRPGAFGVHVVGCHRRHAAPIVDARAQQCREVLGQVRGRLQVHLGGEHDPGCGDRPQVLLGRARGRCVHRRRGLGQEVLDDHLLDVTVPGMAGGDRPQRREAVGPGLADADQDAGRERDLKPAGRLEGGQPAGGRLVRRHAVARQGLREGLDHHPLADGHGAKLGEFAGEQCPRVRMREQTRLGCDESAALCEVVDGRGEAVVGEPCGCNRVAELRAFPEGEEGLVAARLGTGPGDGQDLLGAQVRASEAGRRLREGAVAAAVQAQHRKWDEDLRREGDPRAVTAVAHAARLRQQVFQRCRQQLGVREIQMTARSEAVPGIVGAAASGSGQLGHGLTLPKRFGFPRPPLAEPDHAIGAHSCRGEVVVVENPRHCFMLVSSRDGEHDQASACDPGKGQGEAFVGISARRVHVSPDQQLIWGLECHRVREQ